MRAILMIRFLHREGTGRDRAGACGPRSRGIGMGSFLLGVAHGGTFAGWRRRDRPGAGEVAVRRVGSE